MTDINIGAISEALNDKTDRDMRNVDNTAGADAVIEYQIPNADNDYTWYRKYKSGWVEQGGITTQTATSSVNATILFPVEMQGTEYTITFSVCSSVANDGAESSVLAHTRVGMNLHADSMSSTSGTKGFMWEVKGMAYA